MLRSVWVQGLHEHGSCTGARVQRRHLRVHRSRNCRPAGYGHSPHGSVHAPKTHLCVRPPAQWSGKRGGPAKASRLNSAKEQRWPDPHHKTPPLVLAVIVCASVLRTGPQAPKPRAARHTVYPSDAMNGRAVRDRPPRPAESIGAGGLPASDAQCFTAQSSVERTGPHAHSRTISRQHTATG